MELKDLVTKLNSYFSENFKQEIELPKWKNLNKVNDNTYPYQDLEKDIWQILKSDISNLNLPDAFIRLPSVEWPDFVLDVKNFFELNKDKFSNIKQAADFLYQVLDKHLANIKYLEKVVQQWIFVNLFVNKDFLYDSLALAIYNPLDYGYQDVLQWRKIVVDYSSPNMAKQMTVGHLRSTIIGEVLANIFEFRGANVLRWNYLWDWGTPFGKLIYVFLNLIDEEKCQNAPQSLVETIGCGEHLLENLKQDPIYVLGKMYAWFKDFQDENKEERARQYFRLLSEWDKNINAIWQLFRYLSLLDFENIYNILNISFDTYLWEAFIEEFTDKVIEILDKKGFLIESDGAKVVYFMYWKITEDGEKITEDKERLQKISALNHRQFNLISQAIKEFVPLKAEEVSKLSEEEKAELEVLLIQKKDWTTLYATRDLAWIWFRTQKLEAQEIFYVVGREQALHFKLVFSLADELGWIDYAYLHHIQFGLLLLGGKKMSSRQWNVIRLSDLIDMVKKQILDQYWTRIDNQAAEKLAVSAILINDLKNDPIKDIEFNIEKMTSLQWDTGIYIQYWFVRLKNLLEKIKVNFVELDFEKIIDIKQFEFNEIEKKLLYQIAIFPYVVDRVLYNYKPNILVNWLFEVVKYFNSWYSNSEKILDLKDENLILSKYWILQWLGISIKGAFNLTKIPEVAKM